MSLILAVDDDPGVLRVLDRLLRREGHTIVTADSGEAALATVGAHRPDLILLDVQMGGIDGLETLARLGTQAPGVPVIIMTGLGDVDTVVMAFKRGAADFVVKPFVEEKLLGAVAALADARREPSATTAPSSPTLVGNAPSFREAMDLAVRLAKPDINILLKGETGTGKELFARAIHAASTRRKGPFVAVDCSMLAENLIESELFGHEKGAFTGAVAARTGHFERADGGTLFLDEVGNLSSHVQAKLLRFLQERTIERVGGRETRRLDVRVVSAANIDLQGAVARGTFRMDLYYRLAEATVCPPPLRERQGDVRLLADYFVERYAPRFGVSVKGISREALARLEEHTWPGNVRELEAVIKVAVALAKDFVLPEHLPRWIVEARPAGRAEDAGSGPTPPLDAPGHDGGPAAPSLPGARFRVELASDPEGLDFKTLTNEAIEKAERAVLEAMVQKGHSQAQLAKLMNVDPKTLRGKLRKYGLDTGSA